MKKCKFPAKRWRDVAKSIGRLADSMKDKDQDMIDKCCQMVLSIEDIAILHEHATGCLCWKKAGKKVSA